MLIPAMFAAWTLAANTSFAQEELQQPRLVAPATYDDSYMRPAAEPSPSDEPAPFVPAESSDLSYPTAFGCDEPACGCECGDDCGCSDACGCGSSCGCDSGWSCLGDCCLGDAWTLHDAVDPCCEHDFGGWLSLGYHSDPTRLSEQRGDLRAFNDVPDELNLHQAWLYFEKVADGDCCSSDWGYRFDIMYGTDAQKTQAFGNDDNVWDVSFDNGVYGWAMPQAYFEYAYGDWSVKAGHFLTIVGYEVIPANGNFFYSHALTMFNSEPFTHTGVLANYAANDELTFHAGWTLGWDTGFDQFDGGSSWLGGFTVNCSDCLTFSYVSTVGDLGWRGDGYSHSLVFDAELSDRLNYVLQSDYVNVTDAPAGVGFAGVTNNEDVGVNQYLFYTVNDCWAVGGRMEWWKSNAVTGESASFYELTGGINYRPHANIVFRPEVRYDWTPSDEAVGGDYNNVVFGIDAVMTF